MTTVSTLRALLGHCEWANARLLAYAALVDDQSLDRTFDVGPGTLRRTIEHLCRAEEVWLARWRGEPAGSASEPGTPTIEELRGRFKEAAEQRERFLDAEGPAGESRVISYRDSRGETFEHPLGDLLLHLCNHGFHHRAQALNMLRRVGAEPQNLDLLFMRLDPDRRPDTSFDPDTIAEWFRYATWANDRVLDAAGPLDDELLDQPADIGVGSLRGTLSHIHDAEAWWLKNWAGDTGAFEELPPTTSIAELRERLATVASKRDAQLARTDAEGLQRTVTARPSPERTWTFTLGDTMLQLGGHGTHHRAQAVNILRQLGVEPPVIGYVGWLQVAV